VPDCYVQYGCGFSVGDGWLNFDASPTLRIERIPLIGRLIAAALSGNNQRFPACVRYGDIRHGPLVPSGTAAGVYASHVLEHLALSDFRAALVHTHAMLAPGGVFRLVVPDLFERARHYVDAADANAAENFMRATMLGKEHRRRGIGGLLRDWLGNSAHLWMWDERSLAEELRAVGFTRIRRCEHGDAGIAMFDTVEEVSRFYDAALNIHECAMEAQKPLS
jgi:hypothetical protein